MENQIQENQIQTVDTETGEILPTVFGSNVVQETKDFVIIKKEDGKFEKKMKYQRLTTYTPQTKEEQIELYNVLTNGESSDKVSQLRDCLGKEFTITNIFTNPYESFNEDTGENDYGVTTCMQTDTGHYIVTSSKTVYYSLMNMHKIFGLGMTVRVTGEKKARGTQLNLTLVNA